MLFNSFVFIIFFAVVTVLHFLLPHKFRWVLLLAASYIFYMAWSPAFILLIVFSTFVNYAISLIIFNNKSEENKKKLLILSLIINFGLLFIFKYSVFLNETFMSLFENAASIILRILGYSNESASKTAIALLNKYPLKEFDILLPMGISFYTFQAASYTIDVYKKKIKPIKHYGIFSLYITFFPQLVAGPIERSENLLPQFFKNHRFDAERMLLGLKIMLIGYFKKIVIADRAAVCVNNIYNNPENFGGLYFIIATILFSFQIYCDFSGYSDIAVGSAKVLGYDLMKNFDTPYLSKSIKEFWKRWHISLSSWFMDYVYIPLGGSRCKKALHYRNLLITFLISGLWHGASWTFVLWGGIHGLYQIAGLMFSKVRKGIEKIPVVKYFYNVYCIITTYILVCFAWIFFRANSYQDAVFIIKNLFSDYKNWNVPQYLYTVFSNLGINFYEIKVVFISIAILIISEILSGRKTIYEYFESKPYILRLLYYVLIGSIVLTMGVYYEAGEFIYFQF